MFDPLSTMFRRFVITLAALAAALTLQTQAGQNDGREASKQERTPAPSRKLNFQSDLFTGRFSYSIPLLAAPGRNGSEPQIALQYGSANENGWCGMGWELELVYIQRETRFGVPVKWGAHYPLKEYDDAKGFIFSLGGKTATLVAVGNNAFRVEIEAGFLRFRQLTSGNYWLVTDKRGNRYFFGQGTTNRMFNPKSGWPAGEAQGTFRWALNHIETPAGDTTDITYTNIGGTLYPVAIAYNGHTGGLPNSHRVEFQLGDRADQRIALKSGYRVDTTKRLTNILVKVGGQLVRRYQLDYTNSFSTTRSLIRAVTIYGTNNTASLPPLTLFYTVQPFQFESAVNWTNLYFPDSLSGWKAPVAYGDWGQSVDLVDMDGDGLPDRLLQTLNAPSHSPPYTNFVVQRNNRTGFSDPISWGPILSQGQTSNAFWAMINSINTRFIDINSDGHPDRVMDNISFSTNQLYTNFVVELNNGAGFGGSVSWSNVSPSEVGTAGAFLAIEKPGYVKMTDMNGDGRPDRVMRGWPTQYASPYTNFIVQFNTGNGFTSTNFFGPYSSQGQSNDLYWAALESDVVRLMDMNGDGLPDRVMMPRNPDCNCPYADDRFTNFVVELNNGYGFEPAINWPGVDPQYSQPQQGQCAAQHTPQYCAVNDSGVVALRDINGDGLPDRIMRQFCPPLTNWWVQVNTGTGFAPIKNFGPYFSQGKTNDLTSPYNCIDQIVGDDGVTLLDINGDGLPDRVMSKANWMIGQNYFVVELNKGPFPDLLSAISNGMGGSLSVTYKPSTQYDNRESTDNPNSRRLLPFVMQTVATVSTCDGLYPSDTTTYSYEGGMWHPGRREFGGFARVIAPSPCGMPNVYWFHQAGGRANSQYGEYQDNTNNIGKMGMPFRLETVGSDGLLYQLLLNKVEDAGLGSGRHFAFTSQTLALDHPGNTNHYRATAQQFAYDLGNGNLTNTVDCGEVTSVNVPTHGFTDTGNDGVYCFTTFAALPNTNVLDKPQRAVITEDAGGQTILRETLYDYDGQTGSLTRQRRRLCEGSYVTNRFGYDAYGNRNGETNEAGIATATIYDPTYRTFPVQQTFGGGFTSTFSYDARSGRLLSSTDPKGLVTANSYDAFLRLIETDVSTTPNGPANLWIARYDYRLGMAGGFSTNYVRVRKNDDVDTANGHETWTYFDGLGRLLQVREEAETSGFRVTDTVYSGRGSVMFETLPYFNAGTDFTKPGGTKLGTLREYDPIGRLTKVTAAVNGTFSSGQLTGTSTTGGDTGSPVGPVTLACNDGNDPWVIVHTDEEGKVHKYQLDAFSRTNQIIEVTSGGNYTTTLRYDKAGCLTNTVDHAGNVIEYACNDLGQVVAMADPDMGVWQYRRDFTGRLREQEDAKGQKVRFNYDDPLGRLKSRQIYGSTGAFAYGVTNVYDTSDDTNFLVYAGQLYMTTDNEGWQKNGYDVRGRTLKTARYLSKNGNTYTNQSVYDTPGRVVTNIYPVNGPVLRYTYDTAGNLSEVRRIDGTNNLVFYQPRGFNSVGQLLGINFGNGVVTTHDYFANSKRLSRVISYKTGSTNIQDLAYNFDKVSNLKSIVDGVYSTNASAALSSLVYDDLHRLTSLMRPAVGSNATFSYSPIGNITVSGETGAGTYGYGVRMPQAVKSANGRNYSYDANGSMIVRGTEQLDYDPENRLASFTSFTARCTFGYDRSGARLWKQNGTNLQAWIGSNYEEKQGQALFHVLAADRLVCTFDQTATNVFVYYHPDHRRSTSVLTDKNGNRVQHYEYTAYGQSRFTESTTAFPPSRRHSGRILDEDTGLYCAGRHYYDPQLARFIQADTVVSDSANPQSYNRYSYALNNPLRHFDPSGVRQLQLGFEREMDVPLCKPASLP